MSKLNPVMKWSGSKRSQAEQIVNLIKKDYNTYYEPFCGGCSILFYILNNCPNKFNNYVCSDLNNDLIQTYNIIKSSPNDLYEYYTNFWNELNKDDNIERKKIYFNQIRNEFNKTKNSLLFFCIMRTCTNGMPRYNAKGDFNNSFHITRNGIEPNRIKPIIDQWSVLLNKYNVTFVNQSYDEVNPSKDDFLYLDPPYYNTKGMYYGEIDYDKLWDYLSSIESDYFLSFNGKVDEENFAVNIPSKVYDKHMLLNSGNSSFRRTIGKSSDTIVYESLYIKENC